MNSEGDVVEEQQRLHFQRNQRNPKTNSTCGFAAPRPLHKLMVRVWSVMSGRTGGMALTSRNTCLATGNPVAGWRFVCLELRRVTDLQLLS